MKMGGDDTGDLFSWERGSRADQILQKFWTFFLAHPDVWRLFKKYTFVLIRRGFTHYGAGAVFEQIRWHTNTPDKTEGGLKLSNDLRAYYARMFHAAYPQYNGFFRNRKRPSEDRPGYRNENGYVSIEPPGDETGLMAQLRQLLDQIKDND